MFRGSLVKIGAGRAHHSIEKATAASEGVVNVSLNCPLVVQTDGPDYWVLLVTLVDSPDALLNAHRVPRQNPQLVIDPHFHALLGTHHHYRSPYDRCLIVNRQDVSGRRLR